MTDDITNNQTLCYTDTSITYQNIKKSFVERDKLILILDDSQKIVISGKNIDASGHKSRIRELVSMATEKGFDIPEKSIKHYARDSGGFEYVLVRW